MSYKRVGDFPINSRIKISYDKDGKADVKFDYPHKDYQVKNLWKASSIFLPAFLLSILIFIIVYFLILSKPLEYPQHCSVSPVEDNQTNKVYSIIAACTLNDGSIEGYFFKWKRDIFFDQSFEREELGTSFFYPLRILLIALLSYVIILFLTYLIAKFLARLFGHTKLGNKIYPDYNRIIHNKNWYSEVTTCPKNKIIELPLFTNIYMDYETDGEFSDFLESVEIVEHDFKYIKKNKRKRAVETKPNVYLWKAIFKFKEVPKTGYLRISWT